MIPVYQTIVDKGRGDCMRAALASLFHLDITQVPHFLLFKRAWHDVYVDFCWTMGYDYECTHHGKTRIRSYHLINGAVIAVVKSKTFENCHHAVLINKKGLVIHDPNPNQAWLNTNIIKTGQLIQWEEFKKRTIKQRFPTWDMNWKTRKENMGKPQ
jgi:hypothetical protein